LALTCFCEFFFWLSFGDLSPIILFYFNFYSFTCWSRKVLLPHEIPLCVRSGNCKSPHADLFGAPSQRDNGGIGNR
jgi:hypothetical protein